MSRLGESIAARLKSQLDGLAFVLGPADEERLRRRSAAGQWSAFENLAHLARHHEVMLARLERILAEERPALERYRSEADPEWPRWTTLSVADVSAQLVALRARLCERVFSLSSAELARMGLHPLFGAMSLEQWLDFFLLHEAHHLYVILTRSRG